MEDKLHLVLDNKGLKDGDMEDLREHFINEYSKKQGWNPEDLTNEQLNEIKSQKGYQTPGLLLS